MDNAVQKIQTLSPVHINTKYDRAYLDAGMAGVKLINPSTTEGLETYHSLNELAGKYGTNSGIYKTGAAYFTNIQSPLFQVLNYVPKQSDKDINGNDIDSLTNMLTKYYDSGCEYFLIKYSGDNDNDILRASNFIEAQDIKQLIVDVPTDDASPDLSKTSSVQGNKSTYVVSLPKNNSIDQEIGASFLAEYANAPVGQTPAFIRNLQLNNNTDVQAQDRYEFGAAQNAKYYAPYRVATYANRQGVNMITSSKSQSGDQFQVIAVRDAITTDIIAAIMNIFMQNDRVPYDNTGINMFDGAIRVVLKKYVERNLIQPDFEINPVDTDNIPLRTKASGALSGMSWKYTPVFNIDDATFSQTVVLPAQ